MAEPIHANCRRTFMPAYRQSGRRDTADIIWIVLHSTEGGSARSVAGYFASPTAGGSTHLVVDDRECQRCLPNDVVCWGAQGANRKGFHIEQCGFARWTAKEWFSHAKTLRRAAYKTAWHCHLFGIPAVWVDAAGLKAGHPGVTTHVECSKAFGGDHHDPGTGYPRRIFMLLVRNYLRQIGKET